MLGPMKTPVKHAMARLVASLMVVSLIISMLPTTALADHGDYGELQSAAKEAVKTAESSMLQADVDHAQELVDGLMAGNNKTLLQGRLDAVQGSINTREATVVMAVIDALPPVDALALADKPAVLEARTGYSALTGDQKALVTNLAILEAAEARIDKLEADVAAALAVDKRIDELPAVDKLTLADKDAVAAARDAYTALTAEQKALVTKLDSLTAAEARIAELKTAADKAAAIVVDARIADLPAPNMLTIRNKNYVALARAEYTALTADQKALVTKLAILEAAEARIADLIADATSAALAVDNRIADLPAVDELKLGDKADVETARSAYLALTDDQKAFVMKLAELLAAIDRIEDLEADALAALSIDQLITGLPAVEDLVLYDRSDVEFCRNRFTALTADQKAYVKMLAVLEAAEARIVELQADVDAASAVDNLIAALPNPYYYPPMTLSDKDVVYAAYAAYTALTAEQKALVAVANVEKLETAKAKIDQMEADLPAALKVDAVIAALPALEEMTFADKDAVYAAVAAFDALTRDQQQLVPGAVKLALLHATMYHMELESIPALAVYNRIAALPPLDEITYYNAPAVEAVIAASEAYEQLSTSFQRSLVTNYAVLEAAQARVDEIFAGLFAAADVEYIISDLPNAYELSLDSKADVEAARAAFDALPEGAKPFVRNLAHLEEAEAEIARLEALIQLQPVKDEAINAINALCSSLSEADYHPGWWTRIGELRTIGCNAIQQVETVEYINAIRDDFLAMINAIPKVAQDDPEAVAAAKEAAFNALDASFLAYDSSNYSPENWAALTTVKTNGDTEIEVAGTTAAVYAARDAALQAMSDIPTITAK